MTWRAPWSRARSTIRAEILQKRRPCEGKAAFHRKQRRSQVIVAELTALFPYRQDSPPSVRFFARRRENGPQPRLASRVLRWFRPGIPRRRKAEWERMRWGPYPQALINRGQIKKCCEFLEHPRHRFACPNCCIKVQFTPRSHLQVVGRMFRYRTTPKVDEIVPEFYQCVEALPGLYGTVKRALAK